MALVLDRQLRGREHEPIVAYCILNVNVLDENDEEPEVQLTPLNAEPGSNSSMIYLKEDFEVGG